MLIGGVIVVGPAFVAVIVAVFGGGFNLFVFFRFLFGVQFLSRVLDAGPPDVLRHRLGPGEGLLANNVLHRRDGFTDGPAADQKRLVYRARFSGTLGEMCKENG